MQASAVSGDFTSDGPKRGRELHRGKCSLRACRSLSFDKRVVLDPHKECSDVSVSNGPGNVDRFLIARLNDTSSYFFTWFCKRYRIRVGGRDVRGKLVIQRCPICLDMCPKLIELQCGHSFCRPCLTTSAANNMTSCAICRREQVIDPELLRVQFDEHRMMNLAQRLAIPPPTRPRLPKYGSFIASGARVKDALPSAAMENAFLNERNINQGEELVFQSAKVESLTTHGHLLFGPWGDVGAMTPDDLRRRWKFCCLQTSTTPVFRSLVGDVGEITVSQLADRLAAARGPQGIGSKPIVELKDQWLSACEGIHQESYGACLNKNTGSDKHERDEVKAGREEDRGVTAARCLDGIETYPPISASFREGGQSVGAASTSTLCTRWLTANGHMRTSG